MDLFERCRAAVKPEEVRAIVEIAENNGYRWMYVGDDPTNARTIDIATESSRPIIERLTNSIDAMLELKSFENPGATPSSPRDALKLWYGSPDGHLASLPEDVQERLADSIEVQLRDSGDRKKPTIIIRDRGIGQNPDDMKATLLGLGRSLKTDKPYLYGQYGQGGSTTYVWSDFTVLVSRRNPLLLKNGQTDSVGFSIVQSRSGPKTNEYVYLVRPDGSVPRVEAAELKNPFEPGTMIRHVSYEFGRLAGRMTLASYQPMNYLLFDPVLPFWIKDEIYGQNRRIYGNLSRLRGAETTPNVEYSNTYEVTEGDAKGLKVRYWVFDIKLPKKDEATKDQVRYFLNSYLEREKSTNTVAITLNGQVQGHIEKGLLKGELNISFLSNYLLVQVECDGISMDLKRRLFVSTRERVREGSGRLDLIVEEVLKALRDDDEIADLEKKRREQHLAFSETKLDLQVKKLLDRYIQTSPTMRKGKIGAGIEEPPKDQYIGKDPPMVLRILAAQDPIQIVRGTTRRIAVEFDGPNDITFREKDPAVLSASLSLGAPIEIASVFGPQDGRIRIAMKAPLSAAAGAEDVLNVELRLANGTTLSDSRALILVDPPLPPPTFDPPTVFEFAGGEVPLEFRIGRRNTVTIKCNGPNGLLTREINPGKLTCAFSGISSLAVTGSFDLSKGRIRVIVDVPKEAIEGVRDKLTCVLNLANAAPLEASRDCVTVIEKGPGGDGEELMPLPNYELRQVTPNDENWVMFKWNEKSIGKYDKTGDMLILWVSVGSTGLTQYLTTRGLSPERLETAKGKYVALIGYYLYERYKADERDMEGKGLPEDDVYQAELGRVAATVLITMRPEAEIA